MKKYLYVGLTALNLMSFVSCTTLTANEACALSGDVHTASQIVGGFAYENKRVLCRPAKTAEEKDAVEKLSPIAKKKAQQRQKEWIWAYVMFFPAMLLLRYFIY